VPRIDYTGDEHAVWREVSRELAPLHARYACAESLEASRRVALPRERIPQLAEVNAAIGPLHGFRMLPVAGLVTAKAFLTQLARGVFLSTQYMRHHSVPLYTPEPDVVHELIGHAPPSGTSRSSASTAPSAKRRCAPATTRAWSRSAASTGSPWSSAW
jgi:phenylalanine-4-hydroxylase